MDSDIGELAKLMLKSSSEGNPKHVTGDYDGGKVCLAMVKDGDVPKLEAFLRTLKQ